MGLGVILGLGEFYLNGGLWEMGVCNGLVLRIRLVYYCKTTRTKFVTKLKIEGPSLHIF
jgi:hypothetical protein